MNVVPRWPSAGGGVKQVVGIYQNYKLGKITHINLGPVSDI